MTNKSIIKEKDLVIEMIPVLLYTTKSISRLFERKNELRADTLDMLEKIQFEQKIANLFSVFFACKNDVRIFAKPGQTALFIDDLSNHFFESLRNSSNACNDWEQIEKRLMIYYDLIDKINHGDQSIKEQCIFQLEKFYIKNLGIDEGDQEIQDRISKDSTGNSTWYAYIYMQCFAANEILDKYESIDFT